MPSGVDPAGLVQHLHARQAADLAIELPGIAHVSEQVEMAAVRGEPRVAAASGPRPAEASQTARAIAARSAAVVYFPTPQDGWSSTRSGIAAERRRSTAYPPYIIESRIPSEASSASTWRPPALVDPASHTSIAFAAASSETSIILRSTLFT